jgi:hypothetical protein
MLDTDLQALYAIQDAYYNATPACPAYKPGRSIVTSLYKKEIPGAYVFFTELNRLGCNLPIEVFYREGELDALEIGEFKSTWPKNLNFYQIQSTAKNFVDRWGNTKGWSTKVYAVVESGYQENLWLDIDNIPICNPAFLFDDGEYQSKGSLFWRDLYSIDRADQYCRNSDMWKIFRVPYNDAEPFETGQILLNKPKVWQQLYMLLCFSDNLETYYQFGGDAECWRMAWQHCAVRNQQYHAENNYHASDHVPYGFMPYGPFHKGVPNPWHKYGGGTVMVQRDRKGKELFNHRTINKFNWKDNPFNDDVENEAMYHMAIHHLKTKYGQTGAQ